MVQDCSVFFNVLAQLLGQAVPSCLAFQGSQSCRQGLQRRTSHFMEVKLNGSTRTEQHSLIFYQDTASDSKEQLWKLPISWNIKLSHNGWFSLSYQVLNFPPLFFSKCIKQHFSPTSVNRNHLIWTDIEWMWNQKWIIVDESKCSVLYSQARTGVCLSRLTSRFSDKQRTTNGFRSGIPLIAMRPPDCHAVYPKPVPREYLYQSFKDAANATTVFISCGPSDWR